MTYNVIIPTNPAGYDWTIGSGIQRVLKNPWGAARLLYKSSISIIEGTIDLCMFA